MVKRHEALYPLSHHHHHALVAALKLKRAGTGESQLTCEELKAELKAFWYPGGLQHFREEEEVLLATYSKYGDVNQPLFHKMLTQHILIHGKVNKLLVEETPSFEAFQDLGHFLDEHIRLEEREVFPLIEAIVPEEELWKVNQHFHVNHVE